MVTEPAGVCVILLTLPLGVKLPVEVIDLPVNVDDTEPEGVIVCLCVDFDLPSNSV